MSDSTTPRTIQSMKFSRPEYRSVHLFPSLGDLPNSRIKPRSPSLQADSLPAELQGSCTYCYSNIFIWKHKALLYPDHTLHFLPHLFKNFTYLWNLKIWKPMHLTVDKNKKWKSEVAQSCQTPCNPMDCSLQGSYIKPKC